MTTATTTSFDLYEFGRTLQGKERTMYFQLGSEVQGAKSRKMGFQVDPHYCHEIAISALEATGWKSMKAARAMLSVMRQW